MNTNKCKWKLETDFDDDHYETECGEAICMLEGTPQENHYKYCPYCGKEALAVMGDAVYPHRRHLPAKTRVFIDFLADSFGPEPYWDRPGRDGDRPAVRRAA